MAANASGISFDQWVGAIFSHAVKDPAWYWDPAALWPELPPERALAFVTRLFEDPCPPLARFSDAQLNQGFWFMVSAASGDLLRPLIERDAGWPLRRRAIEAIFVLFERLFATRCTGVLCDINEPGASPLNAACYMWWDIFPGRGLSDDPAVRQTDMAILDVMARTLDIPSVACVESALHGLGHEHVLYPTEVERMIDGWLMQTGELRPELRRYAETARAGRVQ